jgi:Na+(H+)/acetate symporter ActP
MFFSLKNKLVALLITAVLLTGLATVLSHHPMSMGSNSSSNCDTVCQITCFSQVISNVAAIPAHMDMFALFLPTMGIALLVSVIIGLTIYFSETLHHDLGPPLYKKFESYRY